MSVVINFIEKKEVKEPIVKEKGGTKAPNYLKKKVKELNLNSHFLIYILSFALGFIGTIVQYQYPAVNIPSIVLPIPKVIVSSYDTYDISFGDKFTVQEVVNIKEALKVMKLDETPRFRFTTQSELKIRYSKFSENSIYSSFLLPVGHKYWVTGDIKSDSIAQREVLVSKGSSERIRSILSAVYGGSEFNIREVDDLVKELEGKDEGKVIGLVTFEELNEQLQLLTLDGTYFLDDSTSGALRFSVDIVGNLPVHLRKAVSKNTSNLKDTSSKSESVLKINMTGVTAITRGLIPKIEASRDYGYPAKKIGEFLSDADLTHTSNEVSFLAGCAYSTGLQFCSKPEYMKTLKDSGVDIVELTGNHNNDHGSAINTATIEAYKKEGMEYFGGGLNKEDAAKPLVKDMKGSKVAFLGYNYYDTILGTGAIAGESRAGANSFSFEKMDSDIKDAKKIADVVIVTFQFQECYSYPSSDVIYPICYKPLSSPDQKGVFRRAVEYGADIVVGTQAHQPQTYEIYNGKVIYYGLGNLYFDQINWIGTRQGLVLTHYIYEGKLVQTKVSTTLYDNSMQPYVTEGRDSELLLELLKQAR